MKLYDEVMKKDKNKCHECGSKNSLEMHHIIYKSHKIEPTIDNCVMLCRKCHRGEHGVHGRDGFYLDLKLKLELQETYIRKGVPFKERKELMGGKIRLESEYFEEDKNV